MTYTPRTIAKAHQTAALAASAAKPPAPCAEDAFAYLMDMGTGKSKVVLDEWGEMATTGGPMDVIVIAPKGSLRNWYLDKSTEESQWSELRKHVDPEFQERLIHSTWIGSGAAWKSRMRLLLAAHRDKRRPRALFVNVEAFSNSRSDEALKLCLEFAEQRGALVVVDESTTIKSASARTEAVLRIGEASLARRILSGLWTPRSPMDLYWQCEFLSPDILGQRNFYTFQARYATMRRTRIFLPGKSRDGQQNSRWIRQITGYRNIEDLQERVGRYSYRVLKKDCLDLEPKVYASRDVELTAEQRRMIREIKLFGHASIGSGDDRFVTTDMIIKQIIRELQICCGFVMDDDRVLAEVPEKRTNELVSLLSDHAGKAIVWCPWHPALAKIVSRLSKEFGPRSVAQFHGKNVKTRDEEERRFLTDPECTTMVSTQSAGGRGNTWTVADLEVYYANTDNLEHRDQSEDRAHRIGQTRRVTIVDLIAQGTREWKVVQSLRRKIDLATMINREGHREWLV